MIPLASELASLTVVRRTTTPILAVATSGSMLTTPSPTTVTDFVEAEAVVLSLARAAGANGGAVAKNRVVKAIAMVAARQIAVFVHFLRCILMFSLCAQWSSRFNESRDVGFSDCLWRMVLE